MNEATMFEWLLKLQPIGVALVLGLAPALIARWKRRRMTPWYLYGLVCALFAWPAVALPAIHALLVRSYGKPEQISPQRRRASALALLKEESVRSYPSWVAELRRRSRVGIEIRAGVLDLIELLDTRHHERGLGIGHQRFDKPPPSVRLILFSG